MNKLSWGQTTVLAEKLAKEIKKGGKKYNKLLPVPMGGYPVAIYLSNLLGIPIGEPPYLSNGAALIVDDIIDSGRTLTRYPFWDKAVLIAKHGKEKEVGYYAATSTEWVKFPWEKENDIEEHITRFIEFFGENPNREGLKDTPRRVAKAWEHLLKGYKQDPKEILTRTFTQKYDQMILLKDIELYSVCEHHLLPFYGKCHIAYIPNGKVVGISKLARLVEVFARRMQIQEQLTEQIAEALMEALKPKGVGVIVEAKHLCMMSRGVEKQNSEMITSSLKGAFLNDEKTRQEFMRMIGK